MNIEQGWMDEWRLIRETEPMDGFLTVDRVESVRRLPADALLRPGCCPQCGRATCDVWGPHTWYGLKRWHGKLPASWLAFLLPAEPIWMKGKG